jgi:SAM-dependent methyltransferase
MATVSIMALADPDSEQENIIEQPRRRVLSRHEMEDQLTALAPFHHAIDLPYGLSTYDKATARHDRERTRLRSLTDHLWPTLLEAYGGSLAGLRVLDIACNCGGFAIEAARAGAAEVVGIDVDAHYIRQADFIRDALDMENVTFRVARLEDLDEAEIGSFDIVFFFGILYHLSDPIGALQRISAIASDMIVVDTSLLRFRYIDNLVKWPLWRMKVVPAMAESDHDITTGRWRTTKAAQFYPNRIAVREALRFVGFDRVDMLSPTCPALEKRYYQGKRATFIARKTSPRGPRLM